MDATETLNIESASINSEMLHCNAMQHDIIVDVLRQHALEIGDQKYITWLDKGKTESDSFSFAELDRQARSLAVQLQELVAGQKPRYGREAQASALIITYPGLEFVRAFFACLYAGIIAVPTYPLKRGESSHRLNALVTDSEASLVLSDRNNFDPISQFQDVCAKSKLIRLENLKYDRYDDWQYPHIYKHSIAFYQYTSGSTGRPKGVMVTHDNLMSNQRLIAEAMGHDHNLTVVGWLPLFHDMGLIGNLLHPCIMGAPCYLMSPLTFIANPIRWLQAISKYKATTSGGPNFAYELCIARTTAEQRAGLDLKHWQVAFNGSEPIRAATMERFSRTFSNCGFRQSAFYPCYGLAESTLFVTGNTPNRGSTTLTVDKHELELGRVQPLTTLHSTNCKPRNINDGINKVPAIQLVSSGKTYRECQVKIVNPDTCVEQKEQHVGEIWVRSDSVAKGYKNQKLLSNYTFKARLEGFEQPDTYLRTGDLGFLYKDELFVTGRYKDLIIINGRNHYPQDLELTAIQAHSSLVGCRAAAFSVDIKSLERLVIVVSVGKNFIEQALDKEIRLAISEAITHQHGLNLYELIFVRTRLPETSSGKLQRARCKQLYMEGELEKSRI